MSLYAYRLTLRPAYHDLSRLNENDKKCFDAHGEYLHRAAKTGQALLVGRSDARPAENFGLVIFDATDESEARAFMNGDPIVAGGIMTAVVQPFVVFAASDALAKLGTW